MFSVFAEFTFWEEFGSRFNFIAVDYLIYTYEVVNNINQSYPLPWLILAMLTITALIIYLFVKRGYFKATFNGNARFMHRLGLCLVIILIAAFYANEVNNNFAEASNNRYQNELSKAGVYSFFSALKNNELNYEDFYKQIDYNKAFNIVRKELTDSVSVFIKDSLSIKRTIASSGERIQPNVIMITIESFSADFMAYFGNRQGITPVLDSLIGKSMIFTNMYATGTRTVRGMEALSLSVPPTPGSAIVRRSDNDSLTTVGNIFRQKGYATGFFYGGDGYFDNMNQYFGSNGYAITDRGKRVLVSDKFQASRNIIPDSFVHFENAWGIGDEDLYSAVIRDADIKFEQGKLFYDFVMTTSNHRPYTYPTGKINIPSGSGREGAVKYTDYSIGQFINAAKSKAWFQHTIFIFVADHCANSAGKNEIDIAKYHIPAIVYTPKNNTGIVVDQFCSQIDLYPTLLHILNWTYTSNLYGQNVLSKTYNPRAMLGTYQKLAYIRNDSLVILSPGQKIETYRYNKKSNEQIPSPVGDELIQEAIANYQTAYYLFKNGGLKQ
ncbi:MAG: LTA synthase family protein [Ferruginibacter sp.]